MTRLHFQELYMEDGRLVSIEISTTISTDDIIITPIINSSNINGPVIDGSNCKLTLDASTTNVYHYTLDRTTDQSKLILELESGLERNHIVQQARL